MMMIKGASKQNSKVATDWNLELNHDHNQQHQEHHPHPHQHQGQQQAQPPPQQAQQQRLHDQNSETVSSNNVNFEEEEEDMEPEACKRNRSEQQQQRRKQKRQGTRMVTALDVNTTAAAAAAVTTPSTSSTLLSGRANSTPSSSSMASSGDATNDSKQLFAYAAATTERRKGPPSPDRCNNHHHGEKKECNQHTHNKFEDKLDACLDFVHQFRCRCGEMINHSQVQSFLVFLIAVNAIIMGIGTFDFVRKDSTVNTVFERIDQVFLAIFSVEIVMQVTYHGWSTVLDGWLVFDLVIITVSWFFTLVQIIRAFRIFRTLRLVSRIDVMKNLVQALFKTAPRMGAITVLFFVVSYIFAVLFTQLYKESNPEYFERLDHTLFTLFQITTLDNWADIARGVMEYHPFAWIPFFAFVIITSIVFMNLIIAVICDAIRAHHEHNKGNEDDDDDDEAPELLGLDELKTHMKDLTRMQEKTLFCIRALTQQLRTHRQMLSEQKERARKEQRMNPNRTEASPTLLRS